MLRRCLLAYSLLMALTFSTSTDAQDWSHYVPAKGRGDTIKRARRNSGAGAALATNLVILTYWVTDPVAKAIVSDMADRERLTESDANKRYEVYRKEDKFVFIVEVNEVAAGYSRGSLKESASPLSSREIFLQRADNHKEFTKGNIEEGEIDFQLGSGKQTNTYILTFPKKTRGGQSLIRQLDDRVEIQVSLKAKTVLLDYKIKDLVTRIEDL
ncbi:MAG TPA: hypothetical protein VJH03_16725 [Blastocatellia bacterium]|nr:hypothetical protein [Blastocatellia bacterium]